MHKYNFNETFSDNCIIAENRPTLSQAIGMQFWARWGTLSCLYSYMVQIPCFKYILDFAECLNPMEV